MQYFNKPKNKSPRAKNKTCDSVANAGVIKCVSFFLVIHFADGLFFFEAQRNKSRRSNKDGTKKM